MVNNENVLFVGGECFLNSAWTNQSPVFGGWNTKPLNAGSLMQHGGSHQNVASSTPVLQVQTPARFSFQPGRQLLSQRKPGVKVGGTENPAGLQTLLHRINDPPRPPT